MASLFTELVRRKVLRSAALYLAAAWLILQVADLVLEAFDASPAVMRMLILAFAVGFPVFLLLSWFYEFIGARLVKDAGESTAAPRRWSSRTANFAIAVLVVLGAGIYFYSQTSTTRGPGSAVAPRPAVTDDGPTIAVLPLANISSAPDDEYLADGLTEELLNVLISDGCSQHRQAAGRRSRYRGKRKKRRRPAAYLGTARQHEHGAYALVGDVRS
jgi:hypothetical protein